MTPNGAILFAVTVVLGAMFASGPTGLLVTAVLVLVFGLVEVRWRTIGALAWSTAIVLPLAIFLSVVWVVIVGRAPSEVAANVPGTRAAALLHVVTICVRLFLVALVIQLTVRRFHHRTALAFIRAITAPLLVKKLLVLTLSLVDTILHAVDRSRTALVAGGVITARPSLRNIGNGWVLVQTVWLSVTTIAIGRVRDKWPAEHTLARLDEALASDVTGLTISDWVWLAVAVASAVLAFVVR
jgi:hypothetical protein